MVLDVDIGVDVGINVGRSRDKRRILQEVMDGCSRWEERCMVTRCIS